jgi:hypothetical protein
MNVHEWSCPRLYSKILNSSQFHKTKATVEEDLNGITGPNMNLIDPICDKKWHMDLLVVTKDENSCLRDRNFGQASRDMSIIIGRQTTSQPSRLGINTEERHCLRNDGESVGGLEVAEGSIKTILKYITYDTKSWSLKGIKDDESVISSLTNDDDSWILGHRDLVFITPVECDPIHQKMKSKVSSQNSDFQWHNSSKSEKLPAIKNKQDKPMKDESLQITHSTVKNEASEGSSILSVEISKNVSSSSGESHKDSLESFKCSQSNYFDDIRFFDDKLLAGSRQRLQSGKSLGTEIHVGSIVGESTLVTSPLSMFSASVTDESILCNSPRSSYTAGKLILDAIGADEGINCYQVRRSRGIIKAELKYVTKKLFHPIKKMSRFKEKKAELIRSTGNLV